MTFGKFAVTVLIVYAIYYFVVIGHALLLGLGKGKKNTSRDYSVLHLQNVSDKEITNSAQEIPEVGLSEFAESALAKKKN